MCALEVDAWPTTFCLVSAYETDQFLAPRQTRKWDSMSTTYVDYRLTEVIDTAGAEREQSNSR